MAFLVKIPWSIVSAVSQLFWGQTKGDLNKVFNNLTFKLMDALKKQIQSVIDYSLNY